MTRSANWQENLQKRMDQIDAMTPEMRACVHDFGFTIVQQFINSGVKKPAAIRHLVRVVHEGSIEVGPRDGQALNPQFAQTSRLAQALSSIRAAVSPSTFVRIMRDYGLLVVPVGVPDTAVYASVHALHDAGLADAVVERSQKHRVRLERAFLAAAVGAEASP